MGDDGASDTVPIAEWQMEALGATPSPYLKAYRARFLDRRDQQRKTWDLLLAHDSVSIIVYHRDQDALLLVKQFRPAVYASGLARANGAATASTLLESFTYELCAGLLDKPHLNVAETAREEIIEELGFDVRVDDIELVTTYHNSVGLLGTVSTLMYAEVTEAMRVGPGGGIGTEQIEVVPIPVADARTWMLDTTRSRSAGLLFSFLWFLNVKHPAMRGPGAHRT